MLCVPAKVISKPPLATQSSLCEGTELELTGRAASVPPQEMPTMLEAPPAVFFDDKLAQLRAASTGYTECLCRTGQA